MYACNVHLNRSIGFSIISKTNILPRRNTSVRYKQRFFLEVVLLESKTFYIFFG